MRTSSFLLLACTALAACGPKADYRSDQSATNMAADDESAPGGIGVTAAPGVAFNYHYAFSLPSEKIAAAQEAHAQACEKLGIARCRITGMHYALVGEHEVEAMLAFKLDPAIARDFGKQGGAIVQQAGGTLVSADIAGTDAGAAIDQAQVERTRAQEEQKRLDGLLGNARLSASERTELQQQRADTTQRIAASGDNVSVQRESLANTPMVFDYRSGKAIRGFDASAPFTSAADTALGSLQATLAVLLGAIALLGPPALVLLALWLLWRRFGRGIRSALGIRPRTEPASGD